MNVKLVLVVALSLLVTVAHGNFFNDAGNWFKGAGESIKNEANKAGKWVKGAGESIKNEVNKAGKWVEGAEKTLQKTIDGKPTGQYVDPSKPTRWQ